MKHWCDLSFTEKRKIEEGRVNRFSYLDGYSFGVKVKVKKGIERKSRKDCGNNG